MQKISFFFVMILVSFLSAGALAAQPASEPRYVIHLLFDGIGKDVFDEALAQGLMPTVQRELVDKGANFSQAMTSFPTVSSNNYQSVMTGLFPGSSGIPHLVRYSRERDKFVDYLTVRGATHMNGDFVSVTALKSGSPLEDQSAAVFELLRDAGLPSASVYSSFSLGSNRYPRRLPLGAAFSAFVLHHPSGVNNSVYRKVSKLFQQAPEKLPRYTFAAIPATDLATHHHGVGAPQVQKLLKKFDHFFADLLQTLEQRGIREQTTFILSADHGAHNTGKYFELKKLLEQYGVAVKNSSPQQHMAQLALDTRGVSVAMLYLIGQQKNVEKSTEPILFQFEQMQLQNDRVINLPQFLLAHDEVDFFIVRKTPADYILFGKNNTRANIRCIEISDKPWCSYEAERDTDPLAYRSHFPKLADGRVHSLTEWTETFSGEYPDVPVQLWQLFQTERAGDAVVVLGKDWSFRKAKASTHGSFMQQDMHIPLVLQGPGLPRGEFSTARAPDVFPVVLQQLGLTAQGLNNAAPNIFEKTSDSVAERELAQIANLLVSETDLVHKIGFPQFVREQVFPVVPPSRFAQLVPVARAHVEQLSQAQLGLQSDADQLQESIVRSKKVHPRASVVQAKDRLALLRELIKTEQSALLRMNAVNNIVEHCANPDASQCGGWE